MTPLLRADDLERAFPVRRGLRQILQGGPRPVVRALAGVSLAVRRGETLAVVGESGCGKSTLARALVRLTTVDAGQIAFDGEDVRTLRGPALRRYNRRVQMVFQDPYGSLNPRMTAGETLGEALRVHRMVPRAQIGKRVVELLELVRLPADAAARLPHQFSGGQRQRLAIARALAVEPELLIADEIVSALDVSVQAQILNLLLDMQDRLGLAMLFVSHDLRVVRHLAHHVVVMYLGRVVESGSADQVFHEPRHPYTQALLRAAPTLEPGRRTTESAVRGELPSPMRRIEGCPFHPRCPLAFDRCRTEMPRLHQHDGHGATCHLAEDAPLGVMERTGLQAPMSG
jgi:oligopeptide/dipeptide ABC transporter ATP-binding protein